MCLSGSLPELLGYSVVEVIALEDDGDPVDDSRLRRAAGCDALEGSIKVHLLQYVS